MDLQARELFKLCETHGYRVDMLRINYPDRTYYIYTSMGNELSVICTRPGPDGKIRSESVAIVSGPQAAHRAIVEHAAKDALPEPAKAPVDEQVP